MKNNLNLLGIPPNAWYVNDASADLTRPALSPQPITLETETKTLRLDLGKSALIIVDMQNDFCHPDGWLAHIGVSAQQDCPFLDYRPSSLHYESSTFRLFG